MRSTLLVVLATAGCLAAPSGVIDPAALPVDIPMDWAVRAVPFGDAHDHRDPGQHAGLSTANFDVLGFDPLLSARYGRSAGGYLCGDAVEAPDGRRLAVVHGYGTDVAFALADVTDPTAPRMLGELVLPRTRARDVSLTSDGGYVVVATEATKQPDRAGALRLGRAPGATWRTPCGAGLLGATPALAALAADPYPSGVILVDVRDPAAPAVVDYRPEPVLGAHSATTGRVGDVEVAIVAVTNVVQQASWWDFLEVDDGAFVWRSTFRSLPVGHAAAAPNLHNDGWIRVHPGTGTAYAWLADWDGGLVVVDLSDLAAPREVGRWSDYETGDGMDDSGSIHEALPMGELWDGRHYTVLGQEILRHPASTPTGVVTVLDTTDPARIERVGAWTLPVDVEWDEALVYSTHYLTHVGRTVFVASYHAGVWAVDLADPAAPRSAGVYVPDAQSPRPAPRDGGYDWTPVVMEADALPGGDVVVWDATNGVSVVRFDAGRVAPPVEEWDVG